MEKILRKEILDLRSKGKSYKEIRKILGCTLSVISYHCRRANMAGEFTGHKPSNEEIDKANDLYKLGKSLKEISKEVGRTRNCIKKYITGYKIRSRNITRSQSVVNWRKRTKLKLVEYKGGKCEKCGYNKCLEALQFHHLNPKEKDFTIAGKSWSFDKLKLEVDKCSLLCANCHIEEHNIVR